MIRENENHHPPLRWKTKIHQRFGFIYDSLKEWEAVAIPFIKSGLDTGHKCIYIADGDAAGLKVILGENGIDVPSPEYSGNLAILDESQVYAGEGYFDPDRVIVFIIHEAERSLAEDYPALSTGYQRAGTGVG
ncbi:MAG: MEDS domain-containing protein [Dehalococcoidales bacterium]